MNAKERLLRDVEQALALKRVQEALAASSAKEDSMTDREQIRRDAEQITDSPDLYRIHSFADDCLALLAELEHAEWKLENARTVVIPEYERQLAKVPALVEALKAIGEVAFVANEGDPFYCQHEGVDTARAYRLYRDALADWEQT